MLAKRLSLIEVTTELFHVEPLQNYVCFLAEYYHIPENKRLHLSILIEEVFTHIVREAFNNQSDGKITIIVELTQANFVLKFHYLGIPYGYSFDDNKDMESMISNTLVRKLSSSYKMTQNGKNGQIVEINISLPPNVIESLPLAEHQESKIVLASDNVELREIRDNEMKMFVQCLYKVFGYTYSADGVYYPEVLLERKHLGLYKGFVAVNTKGVVVAHAGMLKDTADSVICECGQAFVTPQYGKRGLFADLKRMLINDAGLKGLKGVTSSAVTGHTFTQKVNIHLGCVETGLELGYIPSELESVIKREGELQRQSVMLYFYPTSTHENKTVYVPACHREIIEETYQRLNIPRTIVECEDIVINVNEDSSDIDMALKTEWNQMLLTINKEGKDLHRRIQNLVRQGLLCGAAVIYAALPLNKRDTPHIIGILEKCGFFYAGITPYILAGNDAIKMQYIADFSLDAKYVLSESEWGTKLKDYIFKCKDKANNAS